MKKQVTIRELRINIPSKGRIDRKNMPQLKEKDYQEALAFLKKDFGYSNRKENINPKLLKATQKHFSKAGVETSIERGISRKDIKTLLIGSDNKIVDGHHRWLAAVNAGLEKIPVIRIDAKATDVIIALRSFHKTDFKGIYNKKPVREENLFEALNTPYPYKWAAKAPRYWSAHSEFDYDEDEKGFIEVNIVQTSSRNGQAAWSINFYVDGEDDITSRGNAFRVFSTVIAAIIEWWKKGPKPHVIQFTAKDDNSRVRLYDRFAKSFSKLTKMKYQKTSYGDSYEYEFTKSTVKEGLDEMKVNADDEGGKHLVMQLRKVITLNGKKPVEFSSETVNVSANDARAFITKYMKMKKPAEKEELQRKAAVSYKALKQCLKEEQEVFQKSDPSNLEEWQEVVRDAMNETYSVGKNGYYVGRKPGLRKEKEKEKEMKKETEKKSLSKLKEAFNKRPEKNPKAKAWSAKDSKNKLKKSKNERDSIDKKKEITEISKNTVARYARKATTKLATSDPRDFKTIKKRTKGMQRAITRLTKEEDALNESPGSAFKAGKRDALAGKGRANASDQWAQFANDYHEGYDSVKKKKTVKEGILHELKSKTYKSYIKKASRDAGEKRAEAAREDEVGADPSFSKQARDKARKIASRNLNKATSRYKNIDKAVDKISEAKTELYFKTFSDAVAAAVSKAEKQGYIVDDDDVADSLLRLPTRGRPSVGKTTIFKIPVTKKGQKKTSYLQIQVYGMEGGKFELNSYV